MLVMAAAAVADSRRCAISAMIEWPSCPHAMACWEATQNSSSIATTRIPALRHILRNEIERVWNFEDALRVRALGLVNGIWVKIAPLVTDVGDDGVALCGERLALAALVARRVVGPAGGRCPHDQLTPTEVPDLEEVVGGGSPQLCILLAAGDKEIATFFDLAALNSPSVGSIAKACAV